jgi:hypothetical protein
LLVPPLSGDVAAHDDGGESDCKDGREMRFFRSGDCLRSLRGWWSSESFRSGCVRVETLRRCGRCAGDWKSRGRGISTDGASRGNGAGSLCPGDKGRSRSLLGCVPEALSRGSSSLRLTGSAGVGFGGSIGLETNPPGPSNGFVSTGLRFFLKQSVKELSRSKAAISGRPGARKLISTESP